MRKILGLTLALMLTLPLVAVAAEKAGTVTTIDPASQTFTLDDGTKLTASQGVLLNITPGDQVRAAYEMKGGENVVIEMERTGRDRANDIETE
jgi:hypothetical protein